MNTSIQSQPSAAHKPPLKWVRVLRRLLEGPLHRFDAEKFPVSDHCLPSTVSELNRRNGISITSKLIRLPGYSRAGAYVAEYSLAEESRQAAYKLIGEHQ